MSSAELVLHERGPPSARENVCDPNYGRALFGVPSCDCFASWNPSEVSELN